MRMLKYLPIITLFFLSSCAVRSVYIPISQNSPLFDKNKQLIGTAYIGANHIELQAAFNPMNHLATAANINYGAGIATYDALAGIYSYSNAGKYRYELLGGYGYNSNISHQTNIPSVLTGRDVNFDVSSSYHKLYMQPAIGFFSQIKMYKIHYSFSFSARVGYNRFNYYKYKETDDAGAVLVDKNYSDAELFTFEPCLTNKVGIKNLSAVLQVQTITPYSKAIDVRYTKFSQVVLLSIGIQYNLKFRQKK
jgi:hypothetical protein